MMREMFAAALMFSQALVGAGSTSTTGPVSPSVMVSEMCVVDANGSGMLELLVLWRGSPGWFRKDNGGRSGGGGNMGGGPSPVTRSEWISQGGVNLSVRFDPATRKAWIQDTEIVLDDANVVLVDGVDSPAGPQVVRTLRIDPEYQTRPMRAAPSQIFIRRSPDLVEFLRCDVRLPDASAYEQQMFDAWCTWIRQP